LLPIGERYTGPFNECKYWPIFRIDDDKGWNDTKIINFILTKDNDKEEYAETLVSTLKDLGKTIVRNVVIGRVGAYTVDDEADQYYLVEWASEPREMEENENIIVENTLPTVFKDDWVCEGR
jgi:hypothetical protein